MIAPVLTPLHIVKILAFLPLALLLPGYCTWLLIGRAGDAHREPAVDVLERLFQWGAFSLIVTGWIAVIMTQLGAFTVGRLMVINTVYCLGCILWARQQDSPLLPQIQFVGPSVWLPILGLLALSAALFLRPHELLMGAADAGVYTNLGANIALTGSWIIHDEQLASLDPSLYPALYRAQPPHMVTRFIQFPGFYVSDDQPGVIIPQFYPLFPVSIAILYLLGGIKLGMYAQGLWAVLGCLAVYFAARVLFGKRVGLLAGILLAFCAVQIWFARYPTSETLTQFLVFVGIYAFALYVAGGSRWDGLLAGSALGLVLLARIDMYVLVAVPVVYGVFLWYTRSLTTRYWWFFGPFLILLLHSLAFALWQGWPYFQNTYVPNLPKQPRLWLLGAAGTAMLVLVLIALRSRRRMPPLLAVAQRYGPTVLATCAVLAAAYAYFVWPRLAVARQVYSWYGDAQIPYVEPYNLVRLGWYLSPLGIGLAVAGVWLLLRRHFNVRTALFLGLTLFYSVLYLSNSRNNPHQIYVMRRYLPVVIPASLIAAAYVLDFGLRFAGWRRWLSAVTAVVLAGWLLYDARVVIPHVEQRGALAQMSSLAAVIGPKPAVVLFNDNVAIGTGSILGTPMRYLYGFSVFDLQEELIDEPVLEKQIRQWQADGKRVVIAEGPSAKQDLLASDAFACTPLPEYGWNVPVLEGSYDHFPQAIQRFALPLRLCELSVTP